MEILNHPFELMIAIVLSVVSSVFCWQGMRRKDAPALLLGVGTSIPAFDLADYRYWLGGGAICVMGLMLKRWLDSV